MEYFLLLVDFTLPLLMLYWLVTKGNLSLVYVPFVYFAFRSLEESKILVLYHMLFAGLLLFYVVFNLPFLRKNVFYLILMGLFIFQLRDFQEWKALRLPLIGLFWTFTIIPLAPEICRNYPKEKLFKELSVAGLWILGFFVINSTLATLLKYYPDNHYGFTSGVSFGNLDISEYSILPIAIFLVFRNGILEKRLIYLAVGFAALFLLFLTMRRMVMLLALIGVIIALVELVNFKQIKQLLLYLFLFGVVGLVVIQLTGFSDQLLERFEKRNLAERDLESEGRLLELGMVYKDLFIYYDYDPVFGFGPLNSGGNYGKKIFGNRPLHTDLAYYVHGFGFVGLGLYLAMVGLVFLRSYQRCNSRGDYVQFAFASLYFLAFFIVGSPKAPMSPILLYMVMGCVLGKHKPAEDTEKLEQMKFSYAT